MTQFQKQIHPLLKFLSNVFHKKTTYGNSLETILLTFYQNICNKPKMTQLEKTVLQYCKAAAHPSFDCWFQVWKSIQENLKSKTKSSILFCSQPKKRKRTNLITPRQNIGICIMIQMLARQQRNSIIRLLFITLKRKCFVKIWQTVLIKLQKKIKTLLISCIVQNIKSNGHSHFTMARSSSCKPISLFCTIMCSKL